MTDDERLTITEVAERLAVSKRTVYRLIEDGDLDAERAHRGNTRATTMVVRASAIQRYIDSLGEVVPAEASA